jgi:hypothetical protein
MDAQALAGAMQQDFWAAWDEDAIAGYAYVIRRPGVSWLSRIGTAIAHRRRGVATALMEAVLEHGQRIGLPKTMLYVQTDNPAAIRLYRRFGFCAIESTYQFVLSNPQDRLQEEDTLGIVAVPISKVPASVWPSFPQEWTLIAEMHQPPDTYVLIFRHGAESIGYCRLNPNFPGCFPFVVARPAERLMPALRSMKDYLRSDKSILKLTVWDSAVAEACKGAGLELNYELLKMCRKQGNVP